VIQGVGGGSHAALVLRNRGLRAAARDSRPARRQAARRRVQPSATPDRARPLRPPWRSVLAPLRGRASGPEDPALGHLATGKPDVGLPTEARWADASRTDAAHLQVGAGPAAVRHGPLGQLFTPRLLTSLAITEGCGIQWAADNDCFTGFDPAAAST
jgi:hypothetical protein